MTQSCGSHIRETDIRFWRAGGDQSYGLATDADMRLLW